MENHGHDVIFAGVGGMGALTSGQLLAKAAMKKFKHITWYPNITTARRNAPADCLVRFSHRMISSQLVREVEAAVVMNTIQLSELSKRIKKGGLLIAEDDDLAKGFTRKDIRIIRVPGMEISSRIANPRVVNTVYLGVYVGAAKTVPGEFVEDELRQRFKSKKDVMEMNLQAFHEGIQFVKGA